MGLKSTQQTGSEEEIVTRDGTLERRRGVDSIDKDSNTAVGSPNSTVANLRDGSLDSTRVVEAPGRRKKKRS